jgi:hypothetical protein
MDPSPITRTRDTLFNKEWHNLHLPIFFSGNAIWTWLHHLVCNVVASSSTVHIPMPFTTIYSAKLLAMRMRPIGQSTSRPFGRFSPLIRLVWQWGMGERKNAKNILFVGTPNVRGLFPSCSSQFCA